MLTNTIKNTLALLVALPAIACAGTVQLPATGQTSCYNSKGAAIPCAGTGQDGEKRAGVAWPAPRFAGDAAGTVTDKLTGLTWSRHANAPDLPPPMACPNAEGDMSWQQALDYIKCLNTGSYLGFNDWRLPNLNELESVTYAEVDDSAAWLNANGFGQPGVVKSQARSGGYWTATSDASDDAFQSGASAWDVDLVRGDFSFSSEKVPLDPLLDVRRVWPVRGASTAPAMLWRTGQQTCFDALGAQISCAGTGQDGEKSAGAAGTGPRFKKSPDGTRALDLLTGLIWATDSQSPGPAVCQGSGLILSWQEALDQVKCLNQHSYSGAGDWRLPNRKELRSLADYSRGNPALPAGHPFLNEEGNTLWSSTTDASRPGKAWAVSLYDGSLSGVDKGNLLAALPVSGPDLVPPALTIAQGDMTAKTASQPLSGTVEAGGTVQVAVNGGASAAATVTGTTWSFTASQLAEGPNAIAVTATDFSENSTGKSISITVDFALNSYTVTKNAGPNGGISGPSTAIFGTTPSYTITPAPGSFTTGVTVNGVSQGVVSTVTLAPITGNVIVAATFDIINYTLTATSDSKGSISPAGTANGRHGSSQTYTFAPNPGYQVVKVVVDGVDQGPVPPSTFTFNNITANGHTLKVSFIPDGDMDGNGAVNLSDALRALQIAVQLVPASAQDMRHGDVAPFDGVGIPVPNDQITVADALGILRKMVGLTSGF